LFLRSISRHSSAVPARREKRNWNALNISELIAENVSFFW
jgi:hypothetical protein